MSASAAAPTVRAEYESSLTFSLDDRHWRVRGLESQLSCERLRVNLMVERRELLHVDSLDLYVARLRHQFIKQAAAELFCEPATIKQDLGHVLREVEHQQDRLIRRTLRDRTPEVPPMSDTQRRRAMTLLEDPRLVDRIGDHFEACGLVGEQTNKLVCYLACVSRLLPQPLAVLVQSSSAAGKTTLQDAVLRFMPPELHLRLSALTAQSLYYLPEDRLCHKILAVAEEDGLQEATYALKVLQSDGQLSIASTAWNADARRQQTRLYQVRGPVAMLLTTTAQVPHPELANRCLVLSADEQPGQTAAIHRRQREAYQPAPSKAPDHADRLAACHQHAQRLLEPLQVVIPWADQLTFRTDQIRHRRDHAKYLTLIASITLLHQYQRKQLPPADRNQTIGRVVASLEDLRLANALAGQVLSEPSDSLVPATRRLLSELQAYVARRAAAERLAPSDVRFSQRELRQALERSDRSLRTHLARLVELEYVLVQRSGRGNLRWYQLPGACDDAAAPSGALPLGLADVAQLRAAAVTGRAGSP